MYMWYCHSSFSCAMKYLQSGLVRTPACLLSLINYLANKVSCYCLQKILLDRESTANYHSHLQYMDKHISKYNYETNTEIVLKIHTNILLNQT